MTVYEYEVKLIVTTEDDAKTSVTMTQYAYSISDTVAQAIYALQRDYPRIKNIEVEKVGPPARLIALSARDLEAQVERMVKRLATLVK